MRAASRKSGTRILAAVAATLALCIGRADRAAAQSIGLEAGVANVESFGDARPNLGATLFLPLTQRLRATVSVSQWTGCPEGGCVEPRAGYGNRGLNVLGMFRALGGERSSLSLGAGMGWYEMNRLGDGETGMDTYYDEAFTFAAELRRAVAYNSAVYLRGETSVPTDDSVTRWGALRLGVDVRLF